MGDLSVTPPKSPAPGAGPYELTSDLLRASLRGGQGGDGLFLTWLNTLCAIYLGVGILGARNPQLFMFRPAPSEEIPPILESKLEAEPDKSKEPLSTPDEATTDSPADELPVVVPIPVMDIKDVAFARPVLGMVTVDTKKLGTFDRAAANIGVVGAVAKPGNPNAQAKPTGAAGGRRRLTPDDVDYGPPVPKVQFAKHGRVDIEPGTKIWVTFGEDGAVTEVRIEPPFSHAGYEREVRAHIRKHWRSKVGANSGWAPVD